MITVIQNRCLYEIRFPYDPNLVSLIKNVPGKSWNPHYKVWTIPVDKLGFLLAQLKGTTYEKDVVIQSEESLGVNASLDATKYIPNIDISDINFRVAEGCKPFQHQIDFMKFAKDRRIHGIKSGFILADEPGAGKTFEVMNLALYNRDKYHFKHCLIVCCVNSAKYNWKEDILKHSNGEETPYILGTRLRRNKITERYDTGGEEKLQDLETGHVYGDVAKSELPYFLIVNIEAFRMRRGKLYPFTEKIIEMCNSGTINMIAIDEVHRNMSPSSTQGQKILEVKKKLNRDVEWIPMTGTPITKKPTDVYLPLRLVDGHHYTNYYNWCHKYCIYGGFSDKEIIGYKNIPELKSILQPNMIRRLKSDVLDLPPKIRHTEYVENTSVQTKLYDAIVEKMERDKDSIVKSMNPLASFLRLRQVNGSPELVDDTIQVDSKYLSKNSKLSRTLEIVDEIVENGEKVVIFSNWVEPLRTLYKFVSKKYKTCCYTGTMSEDAREKNKQVFIKNPNYPVIIGTVGALGTSHTLTVANNVIFYDEPWNPCEVEQCEDRCHRPGTTSALNIYTLISKGTVDEVVHKILSTKDGVSKYIVDNNLDIRSNPELFDLLLGQDISITKQ